MSNIDDNLKARMAKLYALSKDPTNEHEASVAFAKLHGLLAQHNISKLELLKEAVDMGSDEFKIENSPWIRFIAQSISKLYFCRAYYNRTRGGSHCWITVTGSKLNRMYAIGLIHGAVIGIKRESNRNSKRDRGYVDSPYTTAFRNGAQVRVSLRCIDLIDSARAGTLKTYEGTTLPVMASVYDNAENAIAEFFKTTNTVITDKNTPVRQVSDRQGFQKGLEEGDKVALNRGVERNAQLQIGK